MCFKNFRESRKKIAHLEPVFVVACFWCCCALFLALCVWCECVCVVFSEVVVVVVFGLFVFLLCGSVLVVCLFLNPTPLKLET